MSSPIADHTGSLNEPSPKATPPSNLESLDELKERALKAYGRHQLSRRQLGEIFNLVHEGITKESSQGKKGKGFRAWLREQNIPPSDAYRWINDYRESLGLPPLGRKSVMPGASATSRSDTGTLSQVGQGDDEPNGFVKPKDVKDFQCIFLNFFEAVPKEQQQSIASDIIRFLDQTYCAGRYTSKKKPTSVPKAERESAVQ